MMRRVTARSGEAVGVMPEPGPPDGPRSPAPPAAARHRRGHRSPASRSTSCLPKVDRRVLGVPEALDGRRRPGSRWCSCAKRRASSWCGCCCGSPRGRRSGSSIATSQLAANALSSIVPAGAAAGATLQVRMLRRGRHRHRDRGLGHDGVHDAAVRDRRRRCRCCSCPRCSLGVLDLGARALDAVADRRDRVRRDRCDRRACSRCSTRRCGGWGASCRRCATGCGGERPPMHGLPDRPRATSATTMRRTLGQHWRRAVLAERRPGRVRLPRAARGGRGGGRASRTRADRGRLRHRRSCSR